MEKDRSHMTEKILSLTLDIISLLTGEDYTIINKSGEHVTPGKRTVLGEWNETKTPITMSPPHSQIQERSNDQKILELIRKILHLLTGEVPIRCQDVAVYFSMEEWEYIEGHQNLCKDVIMENHQTLPSVEKKHYPEGSPHDLYLNQYIEEDHAVLLEYQREDLIDGKVKVLKVEEEKFVSGDQQCPEGEIHSRISTVETSSRSALHKNVLLSSDCKIENSDFQNVCTGQHPATENTPLILPGANISSELCDDNGCFTVKKELVTQSRAHTADKVFSCFQCGKCFRHKVSFISHQRVHTSEKPFPCSECGKWFTCKSDFVKHQRVHKGEKLFPCSECGKQFSQRSNLVVHQRIHTDDKPFTCSQCGKCFRQKSQLTTHQRYHAAKKPFQCSECGKSFTQRSILTDHQRIHTGEKPFPCSECGRCFYSKLTLVRHEKSHTGEKPFPCSECGKRFTRKSDRGIHLRSHTGEKPFPCSECGKRFTRKTGLVSHQRIHTGEKPFVCTECTKCFRYKSSLSTHKITHMS